MASQTAGAGELAERYAQALFDLALADNAADAVERELSQLRDAIVESADLRRLIESPVIGADDKERALGAVLQKSGASQLTRNFLGVVARNRRLFVLPNIIAAYLTIAANHRGEVTAQVISAQPLDEGQVARLRDQIKASVGRDINLDAEVDSGLLGGLIVKVGSRMIDSSLRTKLTRLQSIMKEA